MAITATSQTLFDGERIAIMKFYATMSATENETNVVKVVVEIVPVKVVEYGRTPVPM